jgi:hypothetical protein
MSVLQQGECETLRCNTDDSLESCPLGMWCADDPNDDCDLDDGEECPSICVRGR